jgi:antitoxin (DNA-binding transcriptional repressor) of toxin-antitoxin stability system
MARVSRKKPGTEVPPDTLNRVARGERVILRKGRKPVAAVVSMQDVRRLRALEDLMDAAEGRRRLATEKLIPFEVIRRDAGL